MKIIWEVLHEVLQLSTEFDEIIVQPEWNPLETETCRAENLRVKINVK
jgi:hypothetical protein